jgi:NAD(P)-dependent dehydrogenase (short-subunit alcohol dehydrogenase family)
MFDLTGKTALITGAGQSVGAEIARVLAAQGASVAINDLFDERADAVAKEIAAAGGSALATPGDVTDREDVARIVADATQGFGAIDILVNNAGVPPNPSWDLVPFHETNPESWAEWVDLNLYGVLNTVHAVMGSMVERRWGRIVNIVSDGGRIGEPNVAVYCAAKAGAIGFSKAIAKEAAPHGVTVNCVALGTLGPPDGDADLVAKLARRYPVGRIGQPGDIAPAVLYLASNEAEWVTGQTLPVNGGYTTA